MDAQQFGPYDLLTCLGQGGMGVVHRARHRESGEIVALKILSSTLVGDLRQRFLREAAVGQGITSPYVMQIHDAIEVAAPAGPRHALVMEYVPGTSLRSVLEEEGPLDEVLVRHVATDIARGLRDLHAAGIVHRDLKPDNVILAPGDRIKIVDLGVARYEEGDTRISRTGQFIGSLQYAAPEQFQGGDATDARADLFAWGGMIHELLTGRHPFRDSNVGTVMRRILTETPPAPARVRPELDPFLSTLVMHCLEKDPADRPESAAALVAALESGRRGSWWDRYGRARSASRGPWRPTIDRDVDLIGRAAEQEMLFSAVDRPNALALLVHGPTGMGKSRLVDALLDRVQAGDPAAMVFGTGWESGVAGPEVSASEGLRHALGLPAPSDAVPSRDAVVAALGKRAQQHPVWVVLEDIDRGWPRNRDFLSAFVPELAAARVRVVLTADLDAAPDDAEALGSWLEALGHRVPITACALEALPEHACIALGAAHLGNTALAGDLMPALRDRVGGRPGALLAALDQLHAEGALRRDAQGHVRRTDTTLIAANITPLDGTSRTIARRMAQRESPVRDVLELGACIGLQFDPEEVAGLLGLETLPLLRALAPELRNRELIEPHGRAVRFRSPAIAHAVRAQLPDALAYAYDRALLQRLLPTSGDAPAPEVALRALRHAQAIGDAEALTRVLPAAVEALEHRGAFVSVAELVREVAAQSDLPADLRLALLLRVCMDEAYAATSLDREARLAQAEQLALDLGDDAAWLDARLTRINARLELAGEDQAAALFDAAFETARAQAAPPHRLRADFLAARRSQRNGESARALEQYSALVAAAQSAGLRRLEACAHHALGLLRRQSASPAEGRPHLETMRALAIELEDDALTLDALVSLAFYPFKEGDWETSRSLQLEALAIAVRRGDRPAQVRIHINLAQVMLLAGELGHAYAHALPAVDLARTLWSRTLLIAALRLRVRLGALCGDFADARAAIEALQAASPTGVPHDHHAWIALFEGHLHRAEDAFETALAHYEESNRRFEAAGHAVGRAFAFHRQALCLWELDRPAEALQQLDAGLSLSQQAGDAQYIAQFDLLRACISGTEEEATATTRATWTARLPSWVNAHIAHDFHRAFGRRADAAEAADHLQAAAATLPPERQDAFLHNVPLHARILAAAATST